MMTSGPLLRVSQNHSSPPKNYEKTAISAVFSCYNRLNISYGTLPAKADNLKKEAICLKKLSFGRDTR